VPDDLADYVTSPFTAVEAPVANAAIERAADAVEMALRESFEKAMNIYNRSPSADELRVESQELRVKS
jgi:peptidyl-tRNA hydrolase